MAKIGFHITHGTTKHQPDSVYIADTATTEKAARKEFEKWATDTFCGRKPVICYIIPLSEISTPHLKKIP